MEIRVITLDSDMIRADITITRDVNTGTAEYRAAIRRLTSQVFAQAAKRLPLNKIDVRSPVAWTKGHVLAADIVTAIILRAGLWMLEPILQFLPAVPVAYIGTKRDEGTAAPMSYLCSIPHVTDRTIVFLLDVMLATGGSACDAIMRLTAAGVDPKNIRLLCVFAAQEGIRRVNTTYRDVEIFAAQVDEKLNSDFFIVAGCGDAGDRLSGLEPEVVL